jgi:hypothetical protein
MLWAVSQTSEPALVSFLVDCAFHEQDSVKRNALRTLIDQWRQPAPGVNVDTVWEAMESASRAYKEAPGYQDRWTP